MAHHKFSLGHLAALAPLFFAVTAGPVLADAALTQRQIGDVLLEAYPAAIAGIDGNTVVFRDGRGLVIDDGRGPKTPQMLLSEPDIKDMVAVPYSLTFGGIPARDADPGRARNREFFDALYGDCRKGEVARTLVDVVWLPRKSGITLQVTRLHGAAEKLAAVSRELDALPDRFTAYLVPSAGSYHCRPIAGTNRMSAHGYGIAIDIATTHAHYWRWPLPKPAAPIVYRNAIPPEIVAIFEKHGFIWGGKWYHHDTMHFEYRPEILAAAKLLQR